MELTLRPNKAVFNEILTKQAMNIIANLEPVVISVVDQYVSKLKSAMGGINTAGWMPLTKGDSKFWHETGGLENAIAVAFQVTTTGISIVAGIAPDSPHYDKAVWNEFGFYPQDSDRLIRRPLFEPLAELQVIELNALIRKNFSGQKLHLDMRFM